MASRPCRSESTCPLGLPTGSPPAPFSFPLLEMWLSDHWISVLSTGIYRTCRHQGWGSEREKWRIISEHRARTWIPEAGKGPFLRSVEVYAPVVEKSIERFCVPTSSSPPESHMHKNKTSSFLSPHGPENGTSSGGLHRGREHPCTVLPR